VRCWRADEVEARGPFGPRAGSEFVARPCRLMLSPAQNAIASKQTPTKKIAMTCLLLIVSRSLLLAIVSGSYCAGHCRSRSADLASEYRLIRVPLLRSPD